MRLKILVPIGVTLLLTVWVCGCSLSARVTATHRSSMEQRLLVKSLQRAVDQFKLEQHNGKKVFLDLTGLTSDKDFAKAYIETKLQQAGAIIASAEKDAELRLKVFATAIGVDQTETLFGLPAFAVPLIGAPFPEIALFKWVRNRGYTELQAYTFDAKNGDFISETPSRAGRTKYDLFTILVMISFSKSDIEEPEQPMTTENAED